MGKKQNELSEEDLARVREVIGTGYNETPRKPFRVWVLLLVLWGVVMVLGLLSFGLGIWWGYPL